MASARLASIHTTAHATSTSCCSHQHRLLFLSIAIDITLQTNLPLPSFTPLPHSLSLPRNLDFVHQNRLNLELTSWRNTLLHPDFGLVSMPSTHRCLALEFCEWRGALDHASRHEKRRRAGSSQQPPLQGRRDGDGRTEGENEGGRQRDVRWWGASTPCTRSGDPCRVFTAFVTEKTTEETKVGKSWRQVTEG